MVLAPFLNHIGRFHSCDDVCVVHTAQAGVFGGCFLSRGVAHVRPAVMAPPHDYSAAVPPCALSQMQVPAVGGLHRQEGLLAGTQPTGSDKSSRFHHHTH